MAMNSIAVSEATTQGQEPAKKANKLTPVV